MLEKPFGGRMVPKAVPVPGELPQDPGELLRTGDGVADQHSHGVAVEGVVRSPTPGRLGREYGQVVARDLAIGRAEVSTIAALDQVFSARQN
jgi:hypothetical protein